MNETNEIAAKVNKGDSKVEIFEVVRGIWSPRAVVFESPMLKAVQNKRKKKKKGRGKRKNNCVRNLILQASPALRDLFLSFLPQEVFPPFRSLLWQDSWLWRQSGIKEFSFCPLSLWDLFWFILSCCSVSWLGPELLPCRSSFPILLLICVWSPNYNLPKCFSILYLSCSKSIKEWVRRLVSKSHLFHFLSYIFS